MKPLSLMVLLTSMMLLSSCSGMPSATAPQASSTPEMPAFLRRGVNLGNCLEAPTEGEWGQTIRKEWFKAIKEAGFDHVRIPVRWSAHAVAEPPYTIDAAFLQRVDDVVGWALEQGLAAIVDVHHYAEYCADPDKERAKLYGIWEQLATHYKDMPETVVFEPLNEPNGRADACFNADAAELIKRIRNTNPERWLIIDGVHWSNVPYITQMKLPEDRRLIASVHMYEPMEFTHQGAEWMQGYDKYLGRQWNGTEDEKEKADGLLDIAANMGKKLGVPVYIGEFGAYGRADHASRVRWTEHIARACEARGMLWAYWDFSAGFAVYDSALNQYDEDLLNALIPQ